MLDPVGTSSVSLNAPLASLPVSEATMLTTLDTTVTTPDKINIAGVLVTDAPLVFETFNEYAPELVASNTVNVLTVWLRSKR